MHTGKITIDRAYRIAQIDPRLRGGFIEHLGRAIYGGIYEPDHPTADEMGFRRDVLDLVRELGVAIVRYPGGNFASGYDWEDGVGPLEARPTRLDLAWRSTETNRVGTNEFVEWARRAGAEVMLTVNLGTRGIDDARRLVEYCNHPGGTQLSDLRLAHGVSEPHGIRTWCLGNEMDGLWQLGHKTPDEYGRLACQTAIAMKWVDPSIELIACGSSDRSMSTFPAWEAVVLEHTYEYVDYISLHTYYGSRSSDADLGTYLGRSLEMDEYIRAVAATCDHVRARKRMRKEMMLAFDEWNVWHHSTARDEGLGGWPVAPPMEEERFTMADAVVVGLMLITLLRHADRIRIACLAQLVNAIAPIRTVTGGPAWRLPTYYPVRDAYRLGHGVVLDVRSSSPGYDNREYGEVPLLEATATLDEGREELVVFAVNRSHDAPLMLEGDLRSLEGYALREQIVLDHPDPMAANTVDHPDNVVPRSADGGTVEQGRLRAVLPPLSWNVLRLSARQAAGG